MAKRKRTEHGEEPRTVPDSKKLKKNPQASLLGIPGELRNRIYRYALVEDDYILFSAGNHTEPGLLQTRRQIRKESSAIYLEENRFDISVVDHRPEMPVNWRKHWIHTARRGYLYSGIAKWGNLEEWMRKVHAGLLGGEKHRPRFFEDEPMLYVVQMAMEIVMKARALPWDKVESILEMFKRSVTVGDPSFWDDKK